MSHQWLRFNKRSLPCPVCAGERTDCRQNLETRIVHCRSQVITLPSGLRYIGEDALGFGMYADAHQTEQQHQQWLNALDRRRQQREQEEQARADRSLSIPKRDRAYRQILDQLPLAEIDAHDLLARLERVGITGERAIAAIQASNFKSVERWQSISAIATPLPGLLNSHTLNTQPGYLCPTQDLQGRITGAQIRLRHAEGGRYRWLTSATKRNKNGATPHLPSGELPLSVFRGTHPTHTELSEGTGPKPWITALRTDAIIIGAAGGLWASSPIQLQALLNEAQAIHGSSLVILNADAGAVRNRLVLRQYEALQELVSAWGYTLQVRWWNQVHKEAGDIDEIDPSTLAQAQLLSWKRFQAIAHQQIVQTYKDQSQQILNVLNTLSIAPTQQLNQRYLSDISLPQPGTIKAISSVCNTGKSTLLETLVAQHRNLYPQAKRLMVGSRNGLLRQTGQRTNILHIQDIDALSGKSYAGDLGHVSTAPELALCLDSLQRIPIDSVPEYSLLILDEGDATLKHGLEGGTLRDRQASTLQHFRNLLNTILERKGSLLILEDGLTDLPLKLIQDMTDHRYPLDLVINDHPASPWSVELGTGTLSAFLHQLFQAIEKGQRLIVPTDSQVFGEVIEWMIQALYPKLGVLRLDSKTAEEDWAKSLLKHPDRYLDQQQPHVFIFSPTAESGLNITIPIFDRVMAYLVHLETRTQHQILNRYRLPVPRTIFTRQFGSTASGQSLHPDRILRDWETSARQTAMLTQLDAYLQDEIAQNPDAAYLQQQAEHLQGDRTEEHFWNRWMAFYDARNQASKLRMADNLETLLKQRGHQVQRVEFRQPDAALGELYQQAKQKIEERYTTEWVEADTQHLTLELAYQILNSTGSTAVERLQARKYLKQHQFPGLDFNDAGLVHKAIVRDRGQWLRATQLLWLVQHPNTATKLDRQAYQSQLSQPFLVYRQLKHYRAQVNTFEKFPMLLALGDGRLYKETDALVQQIKQIAVDHRLEMKRILNLTIRSHYSGITIVNKLLRKLGFTCQRIDRIGGKGQQVWRWQVKDHDCPYRQAIFVALTQKYAENQPHSFEPLPVDPSAVSIQWKYGVGSTTVELEAIASSEDCLNDIRDMVSQSDDPETLAILKDIYPDPRIWEAIAG
jgi:hypothetical protein